MSTSLSSPVRAASARTSRRVLATILLARAIWNALFAFYLLQQRERSIASLILTFARFATVDAIFALLLAVAWLFLCPRRSLWLSPAIDAATRAVLVALVAFGPGGVDVPLTAVLYIGLLATFAVVDGALDAAEGMRLEREPGHRQRWLSLAVTGVIAVVVGLVMFVAAPGVGALRLLLVALSLAHALAGALGTRHVSALQESHVDVPARA